MSKSKSKSYSSYSQYADDNESGRLEYFSGYNKEETIIMDNTMKEYLNTSKYTFIGFAIAMAFGIIILIIAVIFSVLYAAPSVYKNFLDAIKFGGTIQTTINFTHSQSYTVPPSIGNNGRALLSITGGGGGGCTGNMSLAGGGGNSGVSAISIPILLHANDICNVIIGVGGSTNNDGTPSQFSCVSMNGGSFTVNFLMLGGRSGCSDVFNSSSTRLGVDSYPFIAERFGSRPQFALMAESNPYGGIGGIFLGGGAGGLFGNGGNPGNASQNGQNGIGFGSGGGGGGINLSIFQITAGGQGGSGFAMLNYYVPILQN